jgi:uncharacterized protein
MIRHTLAAIILCSTFAATPAYAEEQKLQRTLSIAGHGEILAVPDMATISIGVVTSAPNAREALDENTKSMTALFDVVKKAGIENRDIATSNFTVGPRFDYSKDNQPKLVAYDVSNMVTVTVRKLEDLGALLDVSVSSGSNQIQGVSFSVSKPEKLLDEARSKAVADARRKAEIYAAAGKFTLGDIVTLSENAGFTAPAPVFTKAVRVEAADAVPIAQGEQALSVDVSIVYTIKP